MTPDPSPERVPLTMSATELAATLAALVASGSAAHRRALVSGVESHIDALRDSLDEEQADARLFRSIERSAEQDVSDLRAALAEAERERDEAYQRLLRQEDALRVKDKYVDALTARVAALDGALQAACTLRNGRAHFITRNGVPMEMPKKAEHIVRAALAGEAS